VDFRVIVDEGEVLPLPGGIAADKSRRIFALVVAFAIVVKRANAHYSNLGNWLPEAI